MSQAMVLPIMTGVLRAQLARCSALRMHGVAPSSRGFLSGGTFRGLLPQQYDTDYVSPVNGAPRLPSPWNNWFPHEPVPCSPQLHPYKVQCEAGRVYHWCSCGECRTQPWCEDNGGPAGCRSRGFAPVMYEPQHDGTKLMCGCKQCTSAPLFNGTCWVKWADYNTVKAVAMSFGGSFFFGILSSWMAHP